MRRTYVFAPLLFLLLQCGVHAAAQGAEEIATQPPAPVRDGLIKLLERGEVAGALNVGAAARDSGAEPRIIRGNDVVIAPPARAGKSRIRGPKASLKFEQAPIADVVHTVFGDIVKLDYVIHPPVGGTITLSTKAPIPADQILLVIESVLQANGVVMVPDSRGVYHIGRPDALKGIVPAPRRVGNGPLPPGTGTVIVPLSFIGAGEMAEILRPVAPPEAFLRVDTLRNLLLLSGSRGQIEGWMELVAIFDVDVLKGMSVGVFPLQHATAAEVEAALRLMGGGGAVATGKSGQKAPHPMFGAVRIMPIERLNSILVVSPRAAYLDRAREWIERLDQPADNGGEAQLFVYPVRNGSAEHLAAVLNGIFGGGEGVEATHESGVAPSLGAASGATNPAAGGGAVPGAMAAASAGVSVKGKATLTKVSTDTGIRVFADDLNNAVLIYGSSREYKKIESTLRRLDVAPTQVLIEASIIEVTLNDELRYGLQWHFTDTARDGLTGNGVLNTSTTGGIGPIQPGFSYTLTNAIGDVRAVLNALADKSLVKVISSPSLMVLDNHTAAIQVGDQQPIRSSETITEGGVRSTSIEYKDTGVNLAVTPSVNAGNIVTMRINQSVTDVGPIDSATQQRTFLQREIGSKVAVRSGESIVLGGLIRDNTTDGKIGVPGLHDLPVIGALFGTTSKDSTRTELLVVITPRVVRSDQDARDVSRELRERMRGLDGFGPFPRLEPSAVRSSAPLAPEE